MTPSQDRFDLAVVGGGIVGLATAYRYLQRFPGRSLVVIEKEPTLSAHQTGRNSGVLHSGIYYKPGSLKARNCREGKRAMEEFCAAEGIPFDVCGKVIVAVDDTERPRLDGILQRGQANGVRCEMVDAARLRELEPHAAGVAAIHVPETGIVDYVAVCERLAQRVREAGGEVRTGERVVAIEHNGGVTAFTTRGDVAASCIVNCAGLYCDRVAKLGGHRPGVKIIPFRGEYFLLKPSAHRLVKNLIYPTPDPAFPFLGVHFTRMIDGSIECGPNAVLAFAREGYSKFSINPYDLAESLAYPGFLRLAAKYWRTGAGEMWRSASKRAFVRALKRLVPEIEVGDLESAPAGIRAQAVARDGSLVDDFLIERQGAIVNVLNAPSPAATSALEIGRAIVDELA
ncbi:MAG: L-2-hydroxyglutarate oxidase [Pirellulales bacterium]|nr:L-2-hydroxyglutarate oxidase [Pirellulales bacterium]